MRQGFYEKIKKMGINKNRSKSGIKGLFDVHSVGGLLFIVFISVVLLLILLNLLLNNSGKLRQELYQNDRLMKAIEDAGGDPTGDRLLRTILEGTNEIKDEIAAIKKEGGIPEQVFARDIPASENVAVHVMSEFRGVDPKIYDRLRMPFSTFGPWKYESQSFKANENIMVRYSPQRDRIREMLDKPSIKFEQEMVGTKDGLVPDSQNIDANWFYITLEECEIANAMENKDIKAALKSLAYILRFAELASHSRFVEMRVHSAYIRENALRTLQTIVFEPEFGNVETKTVSDILIAQLQKWPSDTKCGFGDRADCLRVYDLLRWGRITDALGQEELEELYSLNVFGEVRDASITGKKREISMEAKIAFLKVDDINKDQTQYLKAMRTIFDSSSKPFYQRLPILYEIEGHFTKLQGTKDYVAIAPLLLRNVHVWMQMQAEDKARVEAWVLALAVKRKFTVKSDAVDPVRGKPYKVTKISIPDGTLIVVSYVDGSSKVEMPE